MSRFATVFVVASMVDKCSDIISPPNPDMNLLKLILAVFRKRMPSWSEVLSVFSVVVFITYSWEIWIYLFGLPSLLFYLGAGQVISVFFYGMAFALLESTLVTSGAAVLSMLLPSNWLKDGFAYKGSLVVMVAAMSLAYIRSHLGANFPPERQLLQDLLVSVLISVLLLIVFHNSPRSRPLLLIILE